MYLSSRPIRGRENAQILFCCTPAAVRKTNKIRRSGAVNKLKNVWSEAVAKVEHFQGQLVIWFKLEILSRARKIQGSRGNLHVDRGISWHGLIFVKEGAGRAALQFNVHRSAAARDQL